MPERRVFRYSIYAGTALLLDILYLLIGFYPPVFSKNLSIVIVDGDQYKEVEYSKNHKISYKRCYYWGGVIFRDYSVGIGESCPIVGNDGSNLVPL